MKLKNSDGAIIINTPYSNSLKFAKKLMANDIHIEPKEAVNSYVLSAIVNNIIIYPNPASGDVKLNYILISRAFVSISIVDITGKEILQIVSEDQKEGNYSVNINLGNIEAGIYFCKFNINNIISLKKIVIQ
ncbi:T9SS type A sorting domain-containing protein [Bacteroidota bacterium]